MDEKWTVAGLVGAVIAVFTAVAFSKSDDQPYIKSSDGDPLPNPLMNYPHVTSSVTEQPQDSRRTGSEFVRLAQGLSDVARENLIYQFVVEGSTPFYQQNLIPVTVSENGKTVTFFASPDVITVGTETDRLRPAMTASTAQKIADLFGMYLPTQKMVDKIYQAAPVKVSFRGFGSPRNTFARHVESNAAIEAGVAGRTGLTAGHSKDYVIGSPLSRFPNSIAIYGGFDTSGSRVQPPSGNAHYLGYLDYSQRPRLIGPTVIVDGVQRPLPDVLADPNYASLLHDGGVTRSLRYPV